MATADNCLSQYNQVKFEFFLQKFKNTLQFTLNYVLPSIKTHIQIFSSPKQQNGGEFPHNTHVPKSPIIILHSGDLI